MVLRRKQARGRPPNDTSSRSPPYRRAKEVASANIAAIMMDTEGPSAKIPKLELNDNPGAENSRSVSKVKDESDPTASGQNLETCAICLGQKVDPTMLDSCIHSFCYTCTSQWFRYSEKCPLCMILTKTFYHNLKAPNGKEAVSVSELHTAAEAARLAERGQSQPPLDEHECIRLRIRRLQRRLSVLQTEMSKNTRDDRKLEFNMANSRLVNEISRLEMLRRDAATRADLVSNVVFRSLIYKDNLDWSSIDRNANRVPFSPIVFREHVTESTDRIRAFLDRELPIVWRSRRPRETREQYFKHRDVVLTDIISWCGEYQINSPQFSRNLRTVGIYPQYLQRFQSELFEFASSMLTLRNFDSTSTYSSAEVRRMLERRNRRGGNSQEVVTVSDSDDTDSAVIPLDNVRGRTGRRRSRRDDDVIVLSDDNLSDQDTPSHRRESNYVRDEATSSNSETSNAGDFYTRPACLLPRNQFHIGNPMRVIDAFGVLRNIYMPRPLSETSLDSMANDLPVMFPRMNLQDHQYSRNSRSRSPVGVVDNTIVLSSEDEDSDRVQRRSRRRTKELSTSRVDHSEASSSSQDTIAANGISWLNPTNTGVHPTAIVSYSSSNSSQPSNTSQNGSVEHRPFRSYFVQSTSRYETPSCSPRTLGDSPSTSNQESNVAPCDSGPSIQDYKSDQKPKSLFQPSPAKIYTPIEGTEVRAENKLLAKLFQERQLRNSQRRSSSSVQMCRDEIDASTMNESTVDTASISSTRQLQNENNKNSVIQLDASKRDAAKVPKLEPHGETPSLQSINGEYGNVVNCEVGASNSSATSGRRKHMSWKHLFKKFRKKMRHEKNQEKRERLYKFIVDMKKEMEKEHSIGNCVKKNDEDYDRNRDHSRHTSSSRRSKLTRYSESRGYSQGNRSRSGSLDYESRKEGRDEYDDDDRYTRRTRSRSRSVFSRSSNHRCSEYSKGSRSRLTSSSSTASRSWTDRGSSRSEHSRNSSRRFSYSGERSLE